MDELLRETTISFQEQWYLKRVTGDNRWVEAGRDEVLSAMYGSPFPYANGLVIGIFKN
jgi:hypothetical protein